MKKLIMILLMSFGCIGGTLDSTTSIDIKKIVECSESKLKDNLLCPSTYQRAKVIYCVDSSSNNRIVIMLYYDAANAYGAPVRSSQLFIGKEDHCMMVIDTKMKIEVLEKILK